MTEFTKSQYFPSLVA